MKTQVNSTKQLPIDKKLSAEAALKIIQEIIDNHNCILINIFTYDYVLTFNPILSNKIVEEYAVKLNNAGINAIFLPENLEYGIPPKLEFKSLLQNSRFQDQNKKSSSPPQEKVVHKNVGFHLMDDSKSIFDEIDYNRLDVVQKWIDHDPDLIQNANSEKSPLVHAIYTGTIEAIKLLLKNNAATPEKLLDIIIKSNRDSKIIDIIKVFSEHGALKNSTHNAMALSWVVARNYPIDIINCVLTLKIDWHYKNNEGLTLIACALRYNKAISVVFKAYDQDVLIEHITQYFKNLNHDMTAQEEEIKELRGAQKQLLSISTALRNTGSPLHQNRPDSSDGVNDKTVDSKYQM